MLPGVALNDGLGLKDTMETEKTLYCGDNNNEGTLKVSIYDAGDSNDQGYIFFDVIGNVVDIYENEITGWLEDAKIDFKFGIDIEKAYLLRDFLNYALAKK